MIFLRLCFFARAEGFEPPSTVLETAILPLNYARSKSFVVANIALFGKITNANGQV